MADSVVVADNVELVANNIQNKVGSTLIGLKSASQETSNKISEPSVGILDGIRTFQQMTVEKVQGVWDILKAQLDFEKEEARIAREQLKPGARPAIRGGQPKGLEGQQEELQSEGLFSKIGAILPATLLTMGGLRLFAGKVFKGGLWAILGALAGNALVSKLELGGTAAQDAIMTTLPTVAGLMAMFNVKKALLIALPVIAALGMKSMVQWLSGDKLASDITGFDWASVAITGPAAIALATAFGAKFTMAGGLALGGVLTIGMPVLIAASLGIALAAGAGYLNSKVTGIEETMLEHLHETSDITQKEFEKNLKDQRANTLAQYFPGLAKLFGSDLTMGQELLLATRAAKKKAKGDEEFMPHETASMMKSIEQLTSMSDETLEDQLSNKHKADEMLKIVHNLKMVAQSGKLGEENSNIAFKKLAAFSQKIQLEAGEIHKQKYGELKSSLTRDDYLFDIWENKGAGIAARGDYSERYAGFEEKIAPLTEEKEAITSDPKYMDLLKLKTMDGGDTNMNETQLEVWNEYQKKLKEIDREIDRQKDRFRINKGMGYNYTDGYVDIEGMIAAGLLSQDDWQTLKANSLVKTLKKQRLVTDNSDDRFSGFTNIDTSSKNINDIKSVTTTGHDSDGNVDNRQKHALDHKIFIQ